jgi:hypothetical protein
VSSDINCPNISITRSWYLWCSRATTASPICRFVRSNTQSKQPSVRPDCQLNKCVDWRTARELSNDICAQRLSSYRSANTLCENGHDEVVDMLDLCT